jgi:peptide/nickel transport system substrate-binding protein
MQSRPFNSAGRALSRVPRRLRYRPSAAKALVASVVASSMIFASAAASSASSSHLRSAGSSSSGGGSGTLNWEWELPTSWDPVTSSAGWDNHVLSLVYATITTVLPNGNVGPGLASSWSYASNGLSVAFTLRPGLTFTDGTPLNAQAVAENIERGQDQANSTMASELSPVSKVVVNGRTSFTLDLTTVDYQIPYLLSGKDGMIVSPKAFKDPGAIPTQPVGAGPFKLTSYVPDSHADLVRNPGYWDASNIHIANFTVQDITQPQEILAALESGQVNVAYIAGNEVAAAKSAGFKIDVIPSEVVDEIDVQTTTKPFTSPSVIEAINYAIDRQSLVQVQQSGYGAPAYQPFPQGFVGYDPKLADLYPYDPAKAKQLLAAAGFNKGVSITITSVTPDDPIAEQIQSQLGAVGIKANISDVPEDTLTQYLYLDKTIPFAIDGTAGRPSPLEMLDVLYSQKGLMNVDGKTSSAPPAVTAALNKVEAVPVTSPDYPSALQGAVATAVVDEPIHIWLYYVPRIFAVSPKVTGIPFDLVQQRWEGVRVAS